MVAPDGIRSRPGWLTLSRGNPTGPAQADKTSVGRTPQTGLVGKLVCPTLIRERSAKAGRPGRSVAASASALGAEDRRFESCRPDTVSQSTALAPEDHHGNAGVAQWQSPSLPSWPCEFDSRHPLHSIAPCHSGIDGLTCGRNRKLMIVQAGHAEGRRACRPQVFPLVSDAVLGRSTHSGGEHQLTRWAIIGPHRPPKLPGCAG